VVLSALTVAREVWSMQPESRQKPND